MAVKIVLDTVRPPDISWCWRDDWYSGACSAFGLMMKFALLNAVSAKDIASAFISRKCGVKTDTCLRPNVDLRDPQLFDLDILSEVFRLSPHQIRAAFLFDLLPHSKMASSEYLRWCETCFERGFHTPIFQMTLLSTCPIHNKLLQTCCQHCGQRIPYRLQQPVLANPFCCPHCKEDMAPGMRGPRPKVQSPRSFDLAAINQLTGFLAVEEHAVYARMRLPGRLEQYGHGELVFSRPSVFGHLSRYIGFISQVLDQVRHPEFRCQAALPMERLERAERGTSTPTLADDDDPELHHPSWANRRERPDNSCHVVGESNTETELASTTAVYRAIRRNLWRHMLRGHQRCIISASRHLWWRVEDDTTPSFCPIAEAYIRWRMVWEGCGTPRYLFGSPRKSLFGLIGWVSSRPSPCPTHWARATQLWVIDHIFANACIESFRERLAAAVANDTQGLIQWQKAESPVRYDTYWAVTGRDQPAEPVVVYLRCPMPHFQAPGASQPGAAHFAAHLAKLSTIAR